MAQSKSSSKQKRAQGGGRPANSEPKIQLFKDFAGINFELSARPNAGTPPYTQASDDRDQTDLQMNYAYLQNNVRLTSNKTLETRCNLVNIMTAPVGTYFTGPTILIGPYLYLAKSDGNIGVGLVPQTTPLRPAVVSSNVPLTNRSGSPSHVWTCFEQTAGKFLALTTVNELWSGDTWTNSGGLISGIENAAQVPNPQAPPTVTPYGNLTISGSATEEETFRILVAYTYVNKYGPTMLSPALVFYANKPVTEWNSYQYAMLTGSVPSGYGVSAVEFYYATDDAESLIFLSRADVSGTSYGFNWYGYSDATNTWHMANLIAPTQNYTKGARCEYMRVVDSRLYFWGDDFRMSRLYIGGNPGNEMSVSPGTGGGYVDVEPGTGQAINSVMKYKTQSGNSIVTILTSSDRTSHEQRFNLVENSVSLSNEQSMKSWQAEQVAGAVGCQGINGALVCQDGLYAVSRYGLALTTMTMEYNSQIRTSYVSDAIRPAFTDNSAGANLRSACLLELDNVIYMTFGAGGHGHGRLDKVIFCYDIESKAWWTYTVDIDEPIMNMIHIDYYQAREGIGIITENNVYLLPMTQEDEANVMPTFPFLIETGKLSTQMPQQGWQYLSQLEFHFDHFVGTMTIELRATDMFGRDITVTKTVMEDVVQYDYTVWMRVDMRLMSYVLTLSGTARFRMTHFLARVYTMSNKVTQVWGFDDSISHRSAGSVHPTFKCYNDIREAIFT